MATESFTSRHVNQAAGTFVIVSAVIVVIAAVLAIRGRHGYDLADTFVVELPEEGSYGLVRGAEVHMLGTSVGSVVDEIHVDPDTGRMRATITVRKEFARFIHRDSKALIKKRFGVAGSAFVEITTGKSDAPLGDGTIEAEASEELPGMVERLLNEIRREVVPTLRQTKLAATEFTALVRDLRAPEGTLKQLLGRLNTIAGQIEQGGGLAGRLVRDPELADRAEELLARSNTSLEELHAILQNVRKTSEELPAIAKTVGDEMEQLPGLVGKVHETMDELRKIMEDVRATTSRLPGIVDKVSADIEGLPLMVAQAQKTLREIERLVEGLQRHWLVRDYMDPDEAGRGPISAAAVDMD